MQRDNYFSLMKGVAITAVVFIHTAFMSQGEFSVAARQIFTFAVAMFFFLSGYLSKDLPIKQQKLGRLLIPYSVWSVLWYGEKLWSGATTINAWSLIDVVFFGGAFFPLYFLIVLAELKLITPLLYSHLNKGTYLWYKDWMLLITPVTVAAVYLYQIQTGKHPAIYAQIFPTWFIQYYLGILAQKGFFKMSSIKALCATLFTIYLMSIESAFMYNDLRLPTLSSSQIKYSSILFSIVLCMLFLSLHKTMKRNLLVVLGELSFGIYLLHIPVKIVIELVLTRIMPLSNPLWQIITVSLTICSCVVIIKIAHRVFPEKLNLYLGLR